MLIFNHSVKRLDDSIARFDGRRLLEICSVENRLQTH